MSEIRVGSYVTHSLKAEWGMGKVFCHYPPYALVGFLGLPSGNRYRRVASSFLRPAEVMADAVLDSWSVESSADCKEVKQITKGGRTRPPRPLIAEWTFEQAFERFLEKHKGGFRDPRYARQERDWKWLKHQLWLDTVSPDGFRALGLRAPGQATELIGRMIQTKVPMLHPQGELVVFRDALGHAERAVTYLSALADLLEAPVLTPELFDKHFEALTSLPLAGTGNLGKWPIVTIIPFLAQPSRHMFLKPGRTKEIARRLGVDLLYSPTPKWDTYERLLAFSNQLFEFLKPHGAKDMIDVQSFIWVVTG